MTWFCNDPFVEWDVDCVDAICCLQEKQEDDDRRAI